MQKKTKHLALAIAASSALLVPVQASSQADPTAAGGGKKPFVLVVIDSSASMEWTDDGDDEFPQFDPTIPTNIPDTVAASSKLLGAYDVQSLVDVQPGNATEGPIAFGPCVVWEPGDEGEDTDKVCKEYVRPPWKGDMPASWTIARPDDKWLKRTDGDVVTSRWFNAMRGSGDLSGGFTGMRLQDNYQPRHVTIKEVMTGEMILYPSGVSDPAGPGVTAFAPSQYGPGCWLVPRMRNASAVPTQDSTICVDPSDSDGLDYNDSEFWSFPDFMQPYPHFQETYDDQWRNGVMDRLGNTVIFGFAAFDGFRERLDRNYDSTGDGYPDAREWYDDLNDSIDGNGLPGYGGSSKDEGDNDCNGDTVNGDRCYDLGLYKVVMPKKLDVPTTYLPYLSNFTQIALNDTGYLRHKDQDKIELDADADKSSDNRYLGATFQDGVDKYIDKFRLGTQPIARATPLAAVMHDTYQFFAEGQDGNNPFSDEGGKPNDPFAECRPKHVVLMTDGKPEPERGDPSTLSAAFGYDVSRYIYDDVVTEISDLTNDVENIVYPTDPADEFQYGVKVHVVGLSIQDESDPTASTAVKTMAEMAMAGQTCAEVLLGPEYLPTAKGGTCDQVPADPDAPARACLVDQSAHTASYTFTRPDADIAENCTFAPALILDTNDPEVLQRALSRLFSEILASSGLASRTRAVVANRLDDLTYTQGGQYRFFSGTRIDGSDYWKGVINRLAQPCGAGAPYPQKSLDQEVGDLVQLGSGKSDRRRVWTVVPDEDIWAFDDRQPQEIGGANNNPTYTQFPMNWKLSQVEDDHDEFQGQYLDAALTMSDLIGTRIPFRGIALEEGYDEAGSSVPHYEQMNATNESELDSIVNTYRARVENRVAVSNGGTLADSRVLGGILNANPVVVGPPNLDLPIGSYREFRAMHADRPTMLYVASMEGFLHALYTGELQDGVPQRALTEEGNYPTSDLGNTAVDAVDQREAWAYMPYLLHRELVGSALSQPYLFDGTPVVKDVRLCNANGRLNTSYACTEVCTDCAYPQPLQWRTVLVEGRGLAGTGYYALDITRPGGISVSESSAGTLRNPDPISLWELDPSWERVQNRYLLAEDPDRVQGDVNSVPDTLTQNCFDLAGILDPDKFWEASLMGLSVSEPEIGTVLVDMGNSAGAVQRPVAVFGGGLPIADDTSCGAAARGMAIYVVDLQTGSILRRFTTWVDENGNERLFWDYNTEDLALDDPGPGYFSGSPALFDGGTGAIASRGFIGDSRGRLFRMDFLSSDPSEWEVNLFFDPYQDTQIEALRNSMSIDGDVPFGPAGFKPGVALTPDRQVTVSYGLGEPGDTVSAGQVQAVLTLVEDLATREGNLVWAEVFPEGEKLTGSPVIFDRTVYFPTYTIPVEDLCEPGSARVWGLQLFDPYPGDIETLGVFQGNTAISSSTRLVTDDASDGDIKWWGPIDPTLIRGVTVTLGPQCGAVSDGTTTTFTPGQATKPQLVVQTSGDVDVEDNIKNADNPGGSAMTNEIDRLVVDLPRPTTQSIPMSWSIISN